MKDIIFGCGSVGEAFFWNAAESGRSVACFCDDRLAGKGNRFLGRDILTAGEALALYPDAVFLIAIPHAVHIIKSLVRQGAKHWRLAHEILTDDGYREYAYTKQRLLAVQEVEECIQFHRGMNDPQRLIVRSVDLVITERCSLRCRDCSNLMQYYRSPMNLRPTELIRDVDRLLSHVDLLSELRIIGGEPLMHPAFRLIVTELLKRERIGRIVIFTNGTIVPEESALDALANEKTTFMITDYGSLSGNVVKLEEQLSARGISYFTNPIEEWNDCASIVRHGRSLADLTALFDACCAKNLTTLLHGRLYRCPFMANATNLKAIRSASEDSVKLLDLVEMPHGTAKETLRDFLYRRDCFAACDACAGRPYGAKGIPPAIQAAHPLPYVEAP